MTRRQQTRLMAAGPGEYPRGPVPHFVAGRRPPAEPDRCQLCGRPILPASRTVKLDGGATAHRRCRWEAERRATGGGG